MAFKTDKELLTDFGNSISDGLKQSLADTAHDIDTFLINENGEAANSLEVVATNNNLKILGSQYIGIAEEGRTETNNPGDGALRRAYERYVRKEGIQPHTSPKTGKVFTIEETAFFMSRATHEKGTPLYQRGGGSGVITSVITDEKIDGLQEDVADLYGELVLTNIENAFTS